MKKYWTVSTLGVTTVLTMTFLGLEARTDLPQVAYPTALDYFVFISFMFIFSTVVQVRIQSSNLNFLCSGTFFGNTSRIIYWVTFGNFLKPSPSSH